jgi:hypothetical protein
VAQHVEDDPAAVLLAVVPRRALRGRLARLRVALEYPVAEFAAYREYSPEEAFVAQPGELQQPRQPQLVLHHAVLHLRLFRRLVKIHRFGERGRHRLLAIDVLAGLDGLLQQSGTQLC